MANYYGNGRSNYVKVKDVEKFKELCDTYGVTFYDVGKPGDKNYQVGFGCEDNEGGDLNSYSYDEKTGDETELPDPMIEFSKLLKDGEVLIMMHTGAEKLRYLVGYAMAINNKQKKVNISLEDIYNESKKLGKKITRCEY